MLDGESLTSEDVVAIADGRPVRLVPKVLPRTRWSREGIEHLLDRGEVAYGVTTGFGVSRTTAYPWSLEQVVELQRNLVHSHATGVCKSLDERATMLIRTNTQVLSARNGKILAS